MKENFCNFIKQNQFNIFIYFFINIFQPKLIFIAVPVETMRENQKIIEITNLVFNISSRK